MAQFRDLTWWYTDDEEILLDAGDRDRGADPDERPALAPLGRDAPRDAAADHLFGRRLETLTLAVLGQLRAKANWHRIAREWVYGDEPVTELGRQEAEFLASVTRVSARLRLAALAALLASRSSSLFALTRLPVARAVRDWIDGYGAAGPLVFIVVSSRSPSSSSRPAAGRRQRAAVRHGAGDAGLDRRRDDRRVAGVRALALVGARRGARRSATTRGRSPLRAWVGARGFHCVLCARIAPGMPYNLVNYAAGLTPSALGAFARRPRSAVAPRAFAYTALGGNIGNSRIAGGDRRDLPAGGRGHDRDLAVAPGER